MTFDLVDAAPVVAGRAEHLLAAYRTAPHGGIALELGVFRGASINRLAASDRDRTFFGFDSFRGLPEPWERGSVGTHPAGHFALGRLPDVESNVVLVVGLFAVALPAFFGATTLPVDFVHIDCDLYRSTAVALAWIGPRLRPGSVLVFDELGDWDGGYPAWREGEWKALQEWQQASGRTVRPISRSDGQQAAFVVGE